MKIADLTIYDWNSFSSNSLSEDEIKKFKAEFIQITS